MSTTSHKSALLVIDVQNGVVQNAVNKDEVVAKINRAIDSARTSSIPVIWVQHSEEEMPIGSEYWQIIPELIPAKDEVRIEKIHGSSFKETKLGEILKDQDISHLYISGAQSENCVNATTVDALERGMKVTLISDAHTTDDASVLASITQKFEDSQKCGHTIVVESLERILPLR